MEPLIDPALSRLHPTGAHPERPERTAVLDGTRVERVATDDQLQRVHARTYLDRLRQVEAPVQLDADTVASATSWEALTRAAGVALEAVDRGGFALVRPPGHHALADRAMGFCLVNNVAVAALYAREELEITRIGILDWDVHHGNGTEAILEGDESVLFVSLHQWPFYPGTGGPHTTRGNIVNVPLPAHSADVDYMRAFDRTVEPALVAFEPELLLVSCGFDAHADDPLAQMELSTEGFRELAARARQLAPRVAAVLEGGYNLETLPSLVESALTGFG
jgi:acetoin utilization deacetylase AcuC-like enzyme